MREAINSALSQTYDNIEVIVVNDGSTDDTETIALSYGDRIRYYVKENGGVSSALNMALREMKGEYVSWLSHDDVYHPEKIERQMAYLSTLKDRDVILYSDFEYIDERSRRVGRERFNHRMLERKPEYGLLRGFINGITLLIPRRAFDEYGYFDESLKCVQDYAKWFEMMSTFHFVHMPEILAKSRSHGAQDTRNNPLVTLEGDVLWKTMMRTLPMDTKLRLEGDELTFYAEMTYYLRTTPYRKATEYANSMANAILSSRGVPAVDYTRKFRFPDRRQIYAKIRFAFYYPGKLLKKYLRFV